MSVQPSKAPTRERHIIFARIAVNAGLMPNLKNTRTKQANSPAFACSRIYRWALRVLIDRRIYVQYAFFRVERGLKKSTACWRVGRAFNRAAGSMPKRRADALTKLFCRSFKGSEFEVGAGALAGG